MSSGSTKPIKTPRFGVCLAADTQTVTRCVLSDNSCSAMSDAEPLQIYKAPFETGEYCENAEEVDIGRCLSTMDAEHCGATSTSCGAEHNFYEDIDPNCSLLADRAASTPTRTIFPACSNLDDETWQCVLGLEDECFDGERFVYAKWAEDWGPSSCHCEDVPTGVCYKMQYSDDDVFTNNLTPDNSFCAVSRNDCPSDHIWITAREFQASNTATYECRLCEESSTTTAADTASTTTTTVIGTTTTVATTTATALFVVEAGACLTPEASHMDFTADQVDSCALEALSCQTNFQFVSHNTLKQQGLNCPFEQTRNWGTCGSEGDPTECTNKATSCMYMYNFRPESGDECSIHGTSQSSLPTYFPHCDPIDDDAQGRCVWSELECDPQTERFTKVDLVDNFGCTCQDVLSGVCKEPSTGEYHCAVSPRGCTDPASYILQRDLEAAGINMKCQLCAPRMPSSNSSPVSPPTIEPTHKPISFPTLEPPPTLNPVQITRPTLPPVPRSTNQPSSKPTVRPTKGPTQSIESLDIDSFNQNKDGDLSTGALAGMAIAAALVCALIVLIITLLSGSNEREVAEDPHEFGSSGEISGDPDVDINLPNEIVVEELPDHDTEPVAPSGTMA